MKSMTLENTFRMLIVCFLATACLAAEPRGDAAKQPSHRLLTIVLEDGEQEMEVTVACANSGVFSAKEHASRSTKKGDDGTNEVSVELSRPEVDFTFFASFKEAGNDSILLTFVMSVSMPEFEFKTQGTAFLEPGKPAPAFNSGNRSVTLFLEKPE